MGDTQTSCEDYSRCWKFHLRSCTFHHGVEDLDYGDEGRAQDEEGANEEDDAHLCIRKRGLIEEEVTRVGNSHFDTSSSRCGGRQGGCGSRQGGAAGYWLAGGGKHHTRFLAVLLHE